MTGALLLRIGKALLSLVKSSESSANSSPVPRCPKFPDTTCGSLQALGQVRWFYVVNMVGGWRPPWEGNSLGLLEFFPSHGERHGKDTANSL